MSYKSLPTKILVRDYLCPVQLVALLGDCPVLHVLTQIACCHIPVSQSHPDMMLTCISWGGFLIYLQLL